MPTKPRRMDANPGLKKNYENDVKRMTEAREEITKLRESGEGMDLEGSKGTFWGVLNAVTEYIDHHQETKGSKFQYALLGRGMDLKTKAFKLIQEAAQAA